MGIAYNPRIVTDGLVLALDAGNPKSYPGSGTTWTDLSGRGNNGTLEGGAGYSSANGGSLTFDGTDEYVDLTSTIQFDTGNFSISGWFISNSGNTSYKQIWNSGYNGGTPDLEIGLLSGTNQLYLYIRPPGVGVLITTTYAVDDNVWRHFTVTKTSSTISLYVNGGLVSSASGTYTSDIDDAAVIPRIGNGLNSINNRPFNGNIAQVSIYNRALTAAEIRQNYNALKGRFVIPSIVTDGLVLNLDAGNSASYPGSGTTWSDLSGNGNTGTISGATYSSANGGALTYSESSITTVPMTNLRPTTAITQECWFLTTNNTAQVFIGSQYGSSTNNSYALWLNAANTWTAGVNIAGSLNYQTYSLTVSTNVWYHFVHTYDGANQRMYINGSQVYSWVTTGSIIYDTNNTLLAVGNDWNGSGYNTGASVGVQGRLAKVSIYNRALTAAEVQQNFNATRSRYGI